MKQLLTYVDHTVLKAFTTKEDIDKLCREAIEFSTASVCVPPCYVGYIKKNYGDKINICTVVGFPLGYSVTESKVCEAKAAIAQGANEIDMVINITDVKNHNYEAVENEIAALKSAVGDKVLKVIIETCYLTQEEKLAMCKAVTNARADFIKTSTGFGTGGASLQDIELFKSNIGPNVKIKAAGGVKSMEDLQSFVNAGCARIGTSAAIELYRGKAAAEY